MHMRAIEVYGIIGDDGQIKLEKPLIVVNQKVKVIVLIPEDQELNDSTWLSGVSRLESFDFLNDEEEDIYTLEDGKPLENEK